MISNRPLAMQSQNPCPCDRASQLIEGYGPTYPAPQAEDIRHAAQILRPPDNQSRVAYMWDDAQQVLDATCPPPPTNPRP